MGREKKAVVLLSGGVDSSTALYIAKDEGYELYALSFDYGQRHMVELGAAAKVASSAGVKEHMVIKIDMRGIGGSALTSDIEVLKRAANADEEGGGAPIPVTYVPARNTIFLSLALGWAEVLGAEDIFIGANAIDYPGYPDCRPEYLRAFEEMANLATKAGAEGSMRFRVRAPLINMTKAEIIRTGLKFGLDYSLTWSCYDPRPDGTSCGECDSCRLREKGFREAEG
jgi:7-cyano-7-deazaguanine synthase